MEDCPVAKRIKEARTAAGLSQKQLGIKAGIDPSTASARMNQYERGTHIPNFSTLKKIAQVLKLPTCYFYAEEDRLAQLLKKSKSPIT